MDIQGLEEFFEVKLIEETGAVKKGDLLSCHFKKGPLEIELILSKSERRLWINADPLAINGNATPAIELNVQYDNLEFETYEGIEKGMIFINKGVKQNLYISKLKNAYSFSFSCDTPNNSSNLTGA